LKGRPRRFVVRDLGEHDHSHEGPGEDDHGHEHERGREHAHGHGSGGGVLGVLGVLRSVFSPHSHGAPSADRALETTALGTRAVFVSLAALGVTALVELVIALISGSVALLADTIHNFADALTAVPLALAFRIGRRPPTRSYTYGFGRAEDLAGICVVAFIVASTVVSGYAAVDRLVHPRPVTAAGWVVVAGLVGVAGNELVAAYRVRVGRRIGSAALVADGIHARADGLTSAAVVVGAVLVLAGYPKADPVVGLLITGAIAVVAVGAARAVLGRLMDSVDPQLVDQVEATLRACPGVDGVDSVRIRWVGHELRAEIRVVSDADLSLVDAHAIAEEAHHRLLHEVPRLAEAVIHTSPAGRHAAGHHDEIAHHFPAPRGEGAAPE
jgi:cation diffusion facilitator family transporter